MQEQLGVREPDFGMLFNDMKFKNEAEISSTLLMQAKAETEWGFILNKDFHMAS